MFKQGYIRCACFAILLLHLLGIVNSSAESLEEITPYHLTLDVDYQLTRTGHIGESLTWVISSGGDILLGRNAANELKYTYFNNIQGKEYVCYLEAWSKDRYVRVSNMVAYRVGVDYNGPTITSKPSIVAKVNEEFEEYQMTATNFPTSFSATGLPPGLEVNEFGIIQGTPTTTGKFLVTLQARNGIDTGSATLDLSIVSGDNGGGHLDDFTLSIDENYRITRSAGPATSLTWVVKKNGIQVLGRNALSETHYTYYQNYGGLITIHLESNVGGEYRRVSNIVSYYPGTSVSNLFISSESLASGVLGKPFSPYQITASGNPTSFSASNLPSGLYVDTLGTIRGTPREIGNFPVTIGAANSTGSTSKAITITISSDPLFPPSLETLFSLSLAEDHTVTRTAGETSALTWIIKRNGITVLERNAANELVYRYYASTESDTYTVHLKAWFNGSYVRVSNIVAYNPSSSNTPNQPVIFIPPTWLVSLNKEVVPFQISASNNPTNYSAQPLPPGLNLNTTTGFVSGTPTSAGRTMSLVTASNGSGSTSASLEIIVTAPGNSGISSLYSLAVSDSLVISRSPGTHPQLAWVFTKDGVVVLKRLAHSETHSSYYRNFLPGEYVAYLEAFVEGRTQIVSNSVGYRIGDPNSAPSAPVTPILSSARNVVCTFNKPWVFQLQATGAVTRIDARGLPPGLAISASGLVSGTPTLAGEFRAQIELTFPGGTSSTPMNFHVLAAQAQSGNYSLILKNNFGVVRTTGEEQALQWVVKRDDKVALKRGASDEYEYTYHGNHLEGSYSIHLEAWRDGGYRIVSNIVSYEVAPFQKSAEGRMLLLEHAMGEVSSGLHSFVEPKFNVTKNQEGQLIATYEYTANKDLAAQGLEMIVEYSLDAETWQPASCNRTILGEDDRVEHRLDKLQAGSAPSAMFRLKVQPIPKAQ